MTPLRDSTFEWSTLQLWAPFLLNKTEVVASVLTLILFQSARLQCHMIFRNAFSFFRSDCLIACSTQTGRLDTFDNWEYHHQKASVHYYHHDRDHIQQNKIDASALSSYCIILHHDAFVVATTWKSGKRLWLQIAETPHAPSVSITRTSFESQDSESTIWVHLIIFHLI